MLHLQGPNNGAMVPVQAAMWLLTKQQCHFCEGYAAASLLLPCHLQCSECVAETLKLPQEHLELYVLAHMRGPVTGAS